MMIIYLIIIMTISRCKLQQHNNRSYNQQRDYNLNHDINRFKVVKNGDLKNSIRIHYVQSPDSLNYLKKDKLYDFSKFIGIKYRSNKNLLIPRYCKKYIKGSNEICAEKCELLKCSDYIPPEEWHAECKYLGSNNKTEIMPEGTGLKNVDLVIYLSLAYTCASYREAYSKVCAQGLKGRPIFGFILICTPKLNKNAGSNVERIIARYTHEMLQIMAFNKALLTSFVKPDGSSDLDKSNPNWIKITAEDLGIMKNISRPRESVKMNYTKNFSVFKLENSVNFVRQHFNCSDLEGIDMVMNFDYQWTFDELKYGEDIMSTKLNPYINDITMLTAVFLVDTGWYYVDYSQANQFYNGRGLGCTFAKGGCYSFIKDKTGDNIGPYCKIPITSIGRKYACSKNRKYYLLCDLHEATFQDNRYIYFKSLEGVASYKVNSFYGSDIETEYCPIFKRFLDNNSDIIPAQCNMKIVNPELRQIIIDYYVGNDSKCLEYNTQRTYVNYGATCFKIINEMKDFFDFEFNNHTFKCNYSKIVEVEKDGFKYQIDCGENPFKIVPIISISIIKYANIFLLLIAISMNIISV